MFLVLGPLCNFALVTTDRGQEVHMGTYRDEEIVMKATVHHGCHIVVTKTLNVVFGEISPEFCNLLLSHCFFHVTSGKVFRFPFASCLHSPVSKDTNEANENWLEDPGRQLKWPLHPTPYLPTSIFISKPDTLGIWVSSCRIHRKSKMKGGNPAQLTKDKTWQQS